MAITNVGYTGTVDRAGWARLAPYLGGPERVITGLTGTVVSGGTRQVSWASGTAYADGVLATMTPAETTTHATVSTGTRWDTVVLRFNSGTSTTALVVVAGGGTEAIAGSLNSNAGVLFDLPIGLVQITAGQTLPTAVRNLTPPGRSLTRMFAYALTGTELDTANFALPDGEEWPQQAGVNLYVPRWATRADLEAKWYGVTNPTPNTNTGGFLWLRLGTLDTSHSRYSPTGLVNEHHSMTLGAAGSLTIPENMRGRTFRLAPRASGPTSGTALELDASSSVSMTVHFRE